VFKETFKEAILHLNEILEERDILLTLGAGDVWKVGEEVLDILK
jgi:UDP-N-acetylmuramate-alanine ligase